MVRMGGVSKPAPLRIISAIHAENLVKKRCQAFLSHLQDDGIVVPPIASILVVCKFLMEFSKDIPGMPFYRDIKFV